jgi:TRAP-type C4-dicarboxylate transport system permease small subunit
MDSIVGVSFQTSTNVNLPAVLGGTNAYVGFSGATGGVNSQQHVSQVSFINLAPLSVQRVGSNVVISWPVASDLVVLKYCTDLGAPEWVNETATVTENNGIRQVTVPISNGPRYYTLGKP